MSDLSPQAHRLLRESLAYMKQHGRHRGSYIESELPMMNVVDKSGINPPACLLGAQIIVAHRSPDFAYSYDPMIAMLPEGDDDSAPLFSEIALALIGAGARYASDDPDDMASQRSPLTEVAMWSDDIESDRTVFAVIESVLA